LLLYTLPFKNNERRACFTCGGDILKEGGLYLPSIAFSSDELPFFGPEDDSIRSGALGDAPFVGIMVVFWLNLKDDW
jgi:hypothetical protein